MPEFVVISRLLGERERLAPFRESHQAYMSKLKAEGRLRMAGRFTDGGGGMYILIADTLASAKDLADRDPYHSNSLREFELREWEQRY
jgi:uncharacterized protein YciI